MAPRKSRRPVAGRKHPASVIAGEQRIKAILRDVSPYRSVRGFEREWLPVAELREWFSDALGNDALKKLAPNIRFEELARDIRVRANRYCNAQLDWYVAADLTELKDVDPAERQNKLLDEVYRHANRLLAVLYKLEELGGPGDDPRWKISQANIQSALGQIGAVPTVPPAPAKTGRPLEPWHGLAREIAALIKSTLREAGYRGDITETHPESAVAVIGAKAINRIQAIGPGGFAAACKERNRRKRKEPPDPTAEELARAIERRRWREPLK
jgi:hypothetical protein